MEYVDVTFNAILIVCVCCDCSLSTLVLIRYVKNIAF